MTKIVSTLAPLPTRPSVPDAQHYTPAVRLLLPTMLSAGLFWAVELVSDRETREPLAPYGGSSPEMSAVVKGCQERGMLPFSNFNRIHVVPPLTTTDDEAREGLAILDAALAAASG